MIVFPYHKNLTNESFPVIPLTFLVAKTKFDTTALIDSGTTISVFKADLAKQLGIDVEKGKLIFLGGVGGHIKGYIHEIKIEIGGKI